MARDFDEIIKDALDDLIEQSVYRLEKEDEEMKTFTNIIAEHDEELLHDKKLRDAYMDLRQYFRVLQRDVYLQGVVDTVKILNRMNVIK